MTTTAKKRGKRQTNSGLNADVEARVQLEVRRKVEGSVLKVDVRQIDTGVYRVNVWGDRGDGRGVRIVHSEVVRE